MGKVSVVPLCVNLAGEGLEYCEQNCSKLCYVEFKVPDGTALYCRNNVGTCIEQSRSNVGFQSAVQLPMVLTQDALVSLQISCQSTGISACATASLDLHAA